MSIHGYHFLSSLLLSVQNSLFAETVSSHEMPQCPEISLSMGYFPKYTDKWIPFWLSVFRGRWKSWLLLFSCSVMSDSFCDFRNCSPPGSSIQKIFQERKLEWVVISFFRGFSQSRDQTQLSLIADGFFYLWATGEAWRSCITDSYSLRAKKKKKKERIQTQYEIVYSN